MASSPTKTEVFYRESDGKPVAETPFHFDVLASTIEALRDWFADDPMAYVVGNLFLYYVEGEPKKVVSPDVMVVRGIDKSVYRNVYKTWEAGKGPDLVIEATSKSTRREDLRKKYELYRDVLRVREYFLFDPLDEYLRPRLQGHRLVGDEYVPIEAVAGRLPSDVVGLHLEGDGHDLRLFDPATGLRLLTRQEALEKVLEERRQRDEDIRRQIEDIRRRDEDIRAKDEAIRRADAEIDRLRRELEALRSGQTPGQG